SMSRDAIEVLPALAGVGSLVPRPQAIPGLKSWDIVRVLPAGYCGGAVALPDGRIATSWSYQSGIFVHRKSDFRVEQVFLPNVSLSGAPLAVSHDGTQIVMGSSTHTSPPFTFSVVNLSTGQTTTIAAGSHAHRPCLAFSRDNQRIVSATYAGPSIWNLRESRLITGPGTPSNSQIRCVAWSPDESQAWTLNETDTFRAYRSTDLSPIPEHPLANEKFEWFALSDIKDSPYQTLAAIMSDGTVRLFGTRDWSVSKSFQLEEPGAMSYTLCAWSPDATRLAVAFNRFVEIWDVANATRLHRIKADVSTMVWREQHLLCLHSVDTSQAIDTANGKVTPISFALVSSPTAGDSALSEDGARLLAESSNRVIEMDAEQGLPIWRSDPRNISNVRYSTDRKNIAVQTWSHETQIWRTEDQKIIKSLPGSSATWSPDDRLLAIREGNGLVKLYDTASWEVTQEFQYQAGERNTMSWSPDGRYLAIRVIPKSAIHFWDTVERKLTSVDSFPENGSEIKQPWFEPKWRSNDRLLVPFAKKFFEVGPQLTTPTLRFGAYEVQGFDYHRERQQTVIVGGGGFDIRDEAGERVFNSLLRTWGPPQWLPDGRRFFTPAWWFGGYPARGYDVDTRQSLGCCFPFIGEESWLTIGPTGHYQGSEGIESEFLYVAEHLDGHQQTYTPAEFAKTFNWKNDPQQATFLKLVETREVKPLADKAKSP
ncbi:MAG: WD40 repeat domain-containing protein, partial [Planctomycetales bacterium]|nr:WD40 repeat domain-containing protein [Planctomycetales bacterium]